MKDFYVVDTRDRFILFAGTLGECVEVQETSYGGLVVLPYDELPSDLVKEADKWLPDKSLGLSLPSFEDEAVPHSHSCDDRADAGDVKKPDSPRDHTGVRQDVLNRPENGRPHSYVEEEAEHEGNHQDGGVQ
jgi:hypothetical protein